jgi:hypothetical protein
VLAPGAAFSWKRVLLAGTRAYWINLLLLIGLHPLPPIAFFIPIGTGFAMGWTIAASRREAVLIAAVMAVWMSAILSLVGIGAGILSAMKPPGILAGDILMFLAIASTIVAHLAIFAGGGALLGGHLARRDLAAGKRLPA